MTTPRVIVILPRPELARSRAVQRQLRVAAYCRVSTDDEEQLTSCEAQQTYYTDIPDGILDPESPGFETEYWFKRRARQTFRVKGIS